MQELMKAIQTILAFAQSLVQKGDPRGQKLIALMKQIAELFKGGAQTGQPQAPAQPAPAQRPEAQGRGVVPARPV